jgi:hypothetical protein
MLLGDLNMTPLQHNPEGCTSVLQPPGHPKNRYPAAWRYVHRCASTLSETEANRARSV